MPLRRRLKKLEEQHPTTAEKQAASDDTIHVWLPTNGRDEPAGRWRNAVTGEVVDTPPHCDDASKG